jgi:hypothetical protein
MSRYRATVVITVALLFAGLGSVADPLLTLAVFVISPLARGRIVIFTLAPVPAFKAPIAQVTGAKPLHVPRVETALTKVELAGSQSLRETPPTLLGPLF